MIPPTGNTLNNTLGILGGMGPMASSLLYQIITQHTKASCDQDHLDILLYSHATMPDRTTAIAQKRDADMIALLTKDCQTLETMGANLIAIPCNTSHYFLPHVKPHLSIPIINMVEETVKEVVARNIKKVCVLATEGTISMGLYQTPLQAQGIDVFSLPCFLQERVNTLIYDHIKAGKTGDFPSFLELESYILGQEVQCIILACTELSVFRRSHPLNPTLYLDALDVLSHRCISSCGRTIQGSLL